MTARGALAGENNAAELSDPPHHVVEDLVATLLVLSPAGNAGQLAWRTSGFCRRSRSRSSSRASVALQTCSATQ
jgi:hypothetical protein